MQPHQERVVAEANELRQKLDKLVIFLNGGLFAQLDREDRQLMTRQSHYMADYLEVLGKRIARFAPH